MILHVLDSKYTGYEFFDYYNPPISHISTDLDLGLFKVLIAVGGGGEAHIKNKSSSSSFIQFLSVFNNNVLKYEPKRWGGG